MADVVGSKNRDLKVVRDVFGVLSQTKRIEIDDLPHEANRQWLEDFRISILHSLFR